MLQKIIELRFLLTAFILQPASYVIHGSVQAFYDMEEVNADCDIWEAMLCDGNIAVSHIAAEETDLLALRKREMKEVGDDVFGADGREDVDDTAGLAVCDAAEIFLLVPAAPGTVPGTGVPFEFVHADCFREPAGRRHGDRVEDVIDNCGGNASVPGNGRKGQGFCEVKGDLEEEQRAHPEGRVEPFRLFKKGFPTVPAEIAVLFERQEGRAARNRDMAYGLGLQGAFDDTVVGAAVWAYAFFRLRERNGKEHRIRMRYLAGDNDFGREAEESVCEFCFCS